MRYSFNVREFQSCLLHQSRTGFVYCAASYVVCVRRSSVNFHMSAYVCFAPRTHIRDMRVPQTICETTHKKPHSHIISNFWPQQPTTMSPQIALRLTRFSHGKFLKPQNLLPITPYITYHICRLAVFVFC